MTNDVENIERKQKALESFQQFASMNPSIEAISIEEIINAMTDDPKSIIIIDTRTDPERNESYLPESITPKEFQKLNEETIQYAKFIVPYCTIGARSGMYAKELVQLGYDRQKVRNGAGIILWSHNLKGIQLLKRVGGNIITTKKVHFFTNKFAMMLSKDYDSVIFTSTEIVYYTGLEILKYFKII